MTSTSKNLKQSTVPRERDCYLCYSYTMQGNGRQSMNKPSYDLPVFEEPQDFRSSMHWRIFRIMAELMDGWQFLADFRNNVAIFGSGNIDPTHAWCKEAEKLGRLLTEEGFDVVTGGGPGIMEAANRGATTAENEIRGKSVGLNIKLGRKVRANPYIEKSTAFHYFFVRNLMMNYTGRAYVYFPGGLGTLDNLTAIITLIQTKKISIKVPIILISHEFWDPVARWIVEKMLNKYNAISKEDVDLYVIVDTAEEAMEYIRKSPIRNEF